jgi:hypothetical protein
MVKDSEEQDVVPCHYGFRTEILYGDVLFADLRVKNALRQIEARLPIGSRPAPAEVIRSQDIRDATPLRLTGKGSIPCTNINNCLLRKAIGEVTKPRLQSGLVGSGCD